MNKEQRKWGGRYARIHPADFNAMAARLGWLPSYPQFSQNSLDLVKKARENGAKTSEEISKYMAQQVKEEKVDWAIENPDDPRNYPRVFFNWRSNLLGDSGKGHEYFVKHLIGAKDQVLTNTENSWQPEAIHMDEEAPEGKTDLFVSLDFHMTSSGLFSDIVLPAATWYEKFDLSSTDMHPFLHPFNAAVSPPWQAKSDWDAFREISKVFQKWQKNICLLVKTW